MADRLSASITKPFLQLWKHNS